MEIRGAQEGIRTPTPLLAPGPEPGASTNSATWAGERGILAETLFYIK